MSNFAYISVAILLTLGIYGMVLKKNLVKKLIGMTILQVAVIMFFIASAVKGGATVPVLDERLGIPNPIHYISPLQHCLMLTAIVVGVATSGVAFALAILIYRRFKTLDEGILLQRMGEK